MIKYDQQIDLSMHNSVSIILKNVSANSKVLEFGPSTGYMTRYMKEKLNCSVYCVELDQESAEISRKYSEKMIIGDLDHIDWYIQLQDEQFDHIIFSDVLEHLRDPWKVLSRAVSLLKDDGTALTSIPNIAHNAIIMELIQGRFEYRNTGLLDNTHIRFFTKKSVLELLHGSGLYPIRWLGTVMLPSYTEFRQHYTEFPETVSDYLENRDDANVYQFVTVSKKVTNVNPNEVVSNYLVDLEKLNIGVMEIFWEGSDGFSSENSIKVPLVNTTTFFEYHIDLPKGVFNKRLRIDPIDRRALVKIQHIRLQQNGEVFYSLDGRAILENAMVNNGFVSATDEEYIRVYSNDDDPQIILHRNQQVSDNVDNDKRMSISIRMCVCNNIFESMTHEVMYLTNQLRETQIRIEDYINEISEINDQLNKNSRNNIELQKLIDKQSEMNADLMEKMQQLRVENNNRIDTTRELESQIYSIKSSRGYRLLLKYYSLRDKLLPRNSSRRTIISSVTRNLFKVVRHMKNYGIKATYRKVKSYLTSSQKVISNSEQPIVKVRFTQSENHAVLENSKVSVVIPTKNAGDDLEPLLIMLLNQKGLDSIEIIMVDSGSTDGSIELANEFGVKVVEILPEEFSHSYARNLGAEHANGDYILFTTQDALPPNDTWIYEMLSVLKNNDVVAVSCAETPREDADLFYRVICWNHYRFLEVDHQDRIMKMPDSADHISLRKNGQLSDIANLISKDVFNQYKYRFNYAEDLDLGIRLIKDGHQIAFLGTTRVIHSHLRNAYYFLKRGYVDNLFLSQLFSDFLIPPVKFENLVDDILRTASTINQIISKTLQKENYEVNEFIEVVDIELKKGIYSCNYYDNLIFDSTEYWDKDLSEFLYECKELYLKQNHGQLIYDGILLFALEGYMNITFEYLRKCYEVLDITLVKEFNVCIVKEFAQLVGAHLAYSYLKNNSKSKHAHSIHETLVKGV
ncbi:MULTISPECIES: glycosyltransferase [Paenibacillus]|uniref:glycosyltransferase n=1 Tax=Paenibacillus TaxID=44249 RepID=UPI0011A3C838|nr:glycosyltransferase [Paenibacillus sp. IHBB 10380]